MRHIAMVVEPLKNGKIVIFDAAPESGVGQRTIEVAIQKATPIHMYEMVMTTE